MRLRDAVLKDSLGRLRLHHLRTGWFADLNEPAVTALESALRDPTAGSPDGRGLVERLRARGLVEEAGFEPIPRRSGPLVSVEVEPVGACNLACRHCFVDFSGARMTEVAFAQALELARSRGVVEMTFNGGEPLLHSRCLDWLARARAAGLRCVLFTNGTLIDAGRAARLAALGLAKAVVSLDGFEPEHEALRGKGTFRRAVSGIRALVAARVPVSITTMVQPANREALEPFTRFCREELGVRSLRLSTVAPLGRAGREPSLMLPAGQLREVYRDSPSDCGHAPGRLLPCAAGADKLFVSAAGKVYPCHLFATPLDRPLGWLDAGAQGDIRAVADEVLDGVLRGFRLDRLAGCAGCRDLAACRGGCRPRAWALTGDPWGRDPVECAKRGCGQLVPSSVT